MHMHADTKAAKKTFLTALFLSVVGSACWNNNSLHPEICMITTPVTGLK